MKTLIDKIADDAVPLVVIGGTGVLLLTIIVCVTIVEVANINGGCL